MNRRTLLQAAAAAMGVSCTRASGTTTMPPPQPLAPQLAPVHVDADRIIRTVVGLRPFRPSGFRVEAERVGERVLVHNYGHGGAGVTLSWGTAHLAVEQIRNMEATRAAVLGCGVVGLSTALLLQEHGWDVTIYAKDLPPNTTSNIAGAQWAPYTVVDPPGRTPQFTEALQRAARFAYRRYQDYVGEEYGVYWRSNYIAGDQPSGFSWELNQVRDLFPETRDLESSDHPFPTQYARHFKAMHIEPARYLRALMRDVLTRGGGITVRAFAGMDEVMTLDEPVIFNCTGLGAGPLVDDREIMPIKGQLTALLPQPEVDYILIAQGRYMMPRSDGIMLGGTHERGVSTMEPDWDAAERIVEGHRRFFGAMT